jgi:hypothetical protein
VYLEIGGTHYEALSNVSFSPEVDVAGNSLPVGEFSADIETEDTIPVGSYATMVGHQGLHFAHYWIVYAERIDPKTVRIRAQSRLILLDRKRLEPRMYKNVSVWFVVTTLFIAAGIQEYSIDASFQSVNLTGFFPEQTARERLLWLCCAAGAYIRNFGDSDTEALYRDKIEFLPIPQEAKLVPMENTVWRPTINYRDHVTAVSAFAYSFSEREPQSGEESVTDGTTTWVVTKQEYTLTNPNVPETAAENVVSVDMSCITAANVDNLLSHLAKYHFPRTEVELECVNNGEYWPGDKLQVYTAPDTIATGWANRADFRFGLESNSKILLTACALVESARLLIRYLYQGAELARRSYHFPVGYVYRVQNPYPDVTAGKLRTIFRPENEYATGTVAAGGSTNNQPCQKALVLNKETRILRIYSVDAVEVVEKTVDGETVLVGVIA